MTKKMTPEAKERLRQAAEAKKGRTTLMGLERTAGLVAFDWVQDRINDGLQPNYRILYDGKVMVTTADGDTSTGWAIKYWRSGEKARNRTTIRWVRLKRCPLWITDEFHNRWGTCR